MSTIVTENSFIDPCSSLAVDLNKFLHLTSFEKKLLEEKDVNEQLFPIG